MLNLTKKKLTGWYINSDSARITGNGEDQQQGRSRNLQCVPLFAVSWIAAGKVIQDKEMEDGWKVGG